MSALIEAAWRPSGRRAEGLEQELELTTAQEESSRSDPLWNNQLRGAEMVGDVIKSC